MMAILSVRQIAAKCLHKSGILSLRHDIFNVNGGQLPQLVPLRSQLQLILATRCPPAVPSNLTVTGVSERTISLAWRDNSDNEEGFVIIWAYGGGSHENKRVIKGLDQTHYILDGLAAGSEYRIAIRAYNQGGESGRSNEVYAETKPSATQPRPRLYICQGAQIPAGYIQVDEEWSPECGPVNPGPGAIRNQLVLDYYADMPVGFRLHVCVDARTPKGWKEIDRYFHATKCIRAAGAKNVKVIERVR